MRIEINKGGLFSGTSVKDFAGEYDDLMEEQRNVIEAFKAVRSKVVRALPKSQSTPASGK